MPFESQSTRKELNGKVIFTSDTWMAYVEREGSHLTPSLQSVAFARGEGSREPMDGRGWVAFYNVAFGRA